MVKLLILSKRLLSLSLWAKALHLCSFSALSLFTFPSLNFVVQAHQMCRTHNFQTHTKKLKNLFFFLSISSTKNKIKFKRSKKLISNLILLIASTLCLINKKRAFSLPVGLNPSLHSSTFPSGLLHKNSHSYLF